MFVCLFVKAEVMCLSADFIRGGGLSADFIRGGGGGGVLRQNSIFPAFGMYVRSKLFYITAEYKIYSLLVAVNGICTLLK